MPTWEQVESKDPGRSESYEEKLDRNWNDLLQELRVMQTGSQIITAFLMTLPFQNRFHDLDDGQRTFYLILLVFSALQTGLIMTPVAIHRRLFGLHVKESTVAQSHRIVIAAVLGAGVMVAGSVAFIVYVVLGWTAAVWAGAGLLLLVALAFVVLPGWLRRTVMKKQNNNHVSSD